MTKTEKIAEAFAFIEESPAQALADALAYEGYDRSERFEWPEPLKPAVVNSAWMARIET